MQVCDPILKQIAYPSLRETFFFPILVEQIAVVPSDCISFAYPPAAKLKRIHNYSYILTLYRLNTNRLNYCDSEYYHNIYLYIYIIHTAFDENILLVFFSYLVKVV